MALSITEVHLHAVDLRTRMPFRYGIATLTQVPYVFVQVEANLDGRHQRGLAADILPPKWFTKNPQTDPQAEIAEMVRVIQRAGRHAQELAPAESVYAFWRQLYDTQRAWGEAAGLPFLLSGFGTSLIERALIDAFCRATQTQFVQAVHANTLGIQLGDIHPELKQLQPADLLPARPRTQFKIRHTVGLADPLTEADIPAAERLNDGLPQSLEACIAHYGLTHFKIKVPADREQAVSRLAAIARLLQAKCPTFAFTLDGNEFFRQMEPFRELWSALQGHPVVGPFLRRGLLLVEQPLHRDIALSNQAQTALRHWPDRPPIIIDESDGDLICLPRALECGYVGASHKNCKGVIHGLANACLLAQRRRLQPAGRWVITGEDLMNVGPVALLQDLTVDALLGVEHVERNGHHYVRGLSAFPEAVQQQMLEQHGDLYVSRETARGPLATLRIHEGAIEVASLLAAPFGYGIDLQVDSLPDCG